MGAGRASNPAVRTTSRPGKAWGRRSPSPTRWAATRCPTGARTSRPRVSSWRCSAQRSDDLLNVYHVIVVDHEGTNTECAEGFADWLLTPETQQMIGEFGVEEYGQQLFHPDAKP